MILDCWSTSDSALQAADQGARKGNEDESRMQRAQQYMATPCNKLQHNAPHCHTLEEESGMQHAQQHTCEQRDQQQKQQWEHNVQLLVDENCRLLQRGQEAEQMVAILQMARDDEHKRMSQLQAEIATQQLKMHKLQQDKHGLNQQNLALQHSEKELQHKVAKLKQDVRVLMDGAQVFISFLRV